MEDDNEILDWGNEDDEHNETLRRTPFDNNKRDTGELDAEDSISLGDEDEESQEYLSYRSEGTNGNGHSSNARVTENQLETPTPTSQESLVTTGAKQESRHVSGEIIHNEPSSPHKSSSVEDFPRRKRDSTDRNSPQRSQPNTGRLTHALPPKPVTTKVPPYLPPSHPSIVEATSMIISPRAGGRETKKSNGVSSGISIPPPADELPHNWEYRESRNGAGKYYYNKETYESTWEKPVSSIPSTSSHAESRIRRRRSPSVGRRHRTPPDSNPHQSQTIRPSRNSTHMQPDRGMDDMTKTAPPDPNGLSYEDRHYRPGGEPPSVPVESRAMERLSEVVNSRVSSQSRYDRMPPAASPPPSRRQPRSPRESRASYLHEKDQSSRGNSHSGRGQNTYTNDPQRDFDTFQPDPGYAAQRWARPPHLLDFPMSDRDSSWQRGRRQDDAQPSRPHPSSIDHSSQDHVQSSHRKRPPLPPQATTFLTSSTAPVYARDAPSHPPAAPAAPRNFRQPDSSGPDGNVPLAPRNMIHVSEEPLPRSGPPSVEYDRDRSRNSSKQLDRVPNNYPTSLPPINTTHIAASSLPASRNNPDTKPPPSTLIDPERKPPTPSVITSSTHAAASSLPAGRSNPDTKPPPPTSIDPSKIRELLPPGKESYERPADLEIAGSQVKTTVNDASIHNNSRPYESSERPPTTVAPGKARQRKSRFDKAAQPEPRSSAREASPNSNKDTTSRSEHRPGNRWPSDSRENSQNRTPQQPQEYIRPAPAPDPPASLSHRLSSNDKPHPRPHSSGEAMSGRDEKSRGEATLSFHNAHAELVREPEDGMTIQDRLERPQAQRRGASLLDRLSTGNSRPNDSGVQQSLRDRIIPSKRDREDMMEDGMRDVPFDGEDGTESKRAKRRNGRARTRGGRRGPP